MTLLLARMLLLAATIPAARATVLVAVETGVEAYAAALEGVGAALGVGAFRVVELRASGPDLSQALGAKDVQAVVAIGSRALAEVCARKLSVPVIATMVLHASELDGCSHVELDIPLAAQLQAMRALWPRRLRVAIIRNPARARYSAEALEAQARKEGYLAVVLDCDGPARLLKAMAEVKGKVDFLLCFPDQDLYNPMTIKPFVLASLEDRLPIVGYSPAFVRAGAAAGVYPDYRDIGRQTGEMALRRLRGDDRGGEEGPRKIQIAVNQRVARLLGADFRTGSAPVEVFR